MTMTVPHADRIDGQRLLSVVAIPLAAAIAMATAVAATGATDRIGEAGGAIAYVLGFLKFCYLAVGMAHVSGAVAERANGGLPAGLWLDEADGSGPRPVPAGADPFWYAFPNHVDGAAIALALTTLCFAVT